MTQPTEDPELPEACRAYLRGQKGIGELRLLQMFLGPEDEWPLLWLRDWSNSEARRAAEVAFDHFAAEVGGVSARAAFRSFLRRLLE